MSRRQPLRKARRGPARGPAPGELPVLRVYSLRRRKASLQVRRVLQLSVPFNPLVQGSTPWRPTGPGLRLRAAAVIRSAAREAGVGPRCRPARNPGEL
jgi:hypothetical protein